MCRLAEFDPIIRRAIRARMGEPVSIDLRHGDDWAALHRIAQARKKRREKLAASPSPGAVGPGNPTE